jgi:ankyrin repeat protein
MPKRILAFGSLITVFLFTVIGCVSMARQLCKASVEGNIERVKSLVQQGADVNEKLSTGVTPIMFACRSGTMDIVEFLVEQGADVNARDKNGLTPLMIAAEMGYFEICRYLIEHGADAKIQDNGGKKATEYTKDPQISEYLITKQ